MIRYKTGQLNKKEQAIIKSLLDDITDIYGDFYVTRSNLRLFLRENQDILFECLQKGDKIIFGEEDGIILVYGFSDKAERKYLKILAKNENSVSKLLKVMNWSIKTDLYVKLKEKNPIINILEKNGFRYKANRGKEILLARKQYINYLSNPIKPKENNNA